MKLVILVRSTVGATEWFTLKITMVSDLIYISTIFDEFFELYINRLSVCDWESYTIYRDFEFKSQNCTYKLFIMKHPVRFRCVI